MPLLRTLKSKILLLVSCTLISSVLINAQDWIFEVRGAYFQPTSNIVKKIYGSGMAEIQGEISRALCDPWYVWLNTSYMAKTGCSSLNHYTRLQVIPVSLGIKYDYALKHNATCYLGLGGSLTSVNIDDDSDFVKRHLKENGVGLVVKSGITYTACSSAFLDLFIDYYHQKVRFLSAVGLQCPNLTISGLRMGAGIGLTF